MYKCTAEQIHSIHLIYFQGLLPGLEEGSEFFERGNGIIEKFCLVVGPEFFYTSLWQVSSIRFNLLPAEAQ